MGEGLSKQAGGANERLAEFKAKVWNPGRP